IEVCIQGPAKSLPAHMSRLSTADNPKTVELCGISAPFRIFGSLTAAHLYSSDELRCAHVSEYSFMSGNRVSPNILVLMTDQQRFDALRCAGNADIVTPNLDRLASRGARFETCYVQNPIC